MLLNVRLYSRNNLITVRTWDVFFDNYIIKIFVCLYFRKPNNEICDQNKALPLAGGLGGYTVDTARNLRILLESTES